MKMKFLNKKDIKINKSHNKKFQTAKRLVVIRKADQRAKLNRGRYSRSSCTDLMSSSSIDKLSIRAQINYHRTERHPP